MAEVPVAERPPQRFAGTGAVFEVEKEHPNEPVFLRQKLPPRPVVTAERVAPLPPYLVQ